MELSVGMYVRTDRGNIFKAERVVELDVNGTWFKSKTKENSVIKVLPRFMYDEEDEVINKASENIIDIVEVGDYVNGKLVAKNKEVITTDNIYIGRYLYEKDNSLIGGEEDIKSIVTKEAFESMSYKVEE